MLTKNLFVSRTMYWADWNRAAPKIEVANMDGGSRRVFIQQRMGLPNGLTLDRRNNELCWTDAMYGSISCANLDEGRSQDVYSAARFV
jgi:sugar lactone lactonase YvrE